MSESFFDDQYVKHFTNHLLRDSDFLRRVARDVDPSLFSDDTTKRVVKLAIEFEKENHAAPGTLVFRVLDSWKEKGLINESLHKVVNLFIDELFALPLQNRHFLLEQFDGFCRKQKAKTLIVPFMEHIKRDNFEEAEALMKELFLFRPTKDQDLGRAYTADTSDRIARRNSEDENRFWTLIPELDMRVSGLRAGEVGIWLSQRSSAGKSAAMQFLTRSAAFQGKKVLIHSLEMSENAYEDRLDQCITGIGKQQLATDGSRISKAVWNMLRHGGGVWIKSFPPGTTISRLREHADSLANVHGFRPDIHILDHLDHVAAENKSLSGDLYGTGKVTSSEWIAWMKEEEMVGWTGSQSNRGAAEATVADMHHASNSIAKVYDADLILSINRTQEEENEGRTTIFVVKNRDGKARYPVTIKTNFEKMAFWTRSD